MPALMVRPEGEVEAWARLLYLSIRDGRLRMRFQLEGAPGEAEDTLDVTFVSETPARPLFSAPAVLSVDGEYRLEVELSEEVAGAWKELRVKDRMPFRWIIR